jgi:uncharacterized membrane protein
MKKYSDVEPITFSKDKKSQKVNRWKSKVVWMSIASLFFIVMGNLGLYKKIGITEDVFKSTVDSVLSVLVVLGILNNPTTEKF